MPVDSSDEDVRTRESREDPKLSWDRFSDFLSHLWVLVLVGFAAIAVYPLIPVEEAQQALFWIICLSLGLGVVSQVAILIGEGIAWIASREPDANTAWSFGTRTSGAWTSPPYSAVVANEPTSAEPPTNATAPN
jgi:hypothetical protein